MTAEGVLVFASASVDAVRAVLDRVRAKFPDEPTILVVPRSFSDAMPDHDETIETPGPLFTRGAIGVARSALHGRRLKAVVIPSDVPGRDAHRRLQFFVLRHVRAHRAELDSGEGRIESIRWSNLRPVRLVFRQVASLAGAVVAITVGGVLLLVHTIRRPQ
jgi:hypothetical protein